MIERIKHLMWASRQIGERNARGVVTIAAIMDKVRASCPNTITDREREDAIAEEAIGAGLVVQFNHTWDGRV